MEYKINKCNHNIKKFIKDIIHQDFNIDYWDEWLDEQDYDCLQVSPNLLISVEDGDNLIGICAVKILNNKESYLNSFYIRKEYRNKGIGNKIFNMCMEYIVENGYEKITLCVDSRFEIAKKMYENRGFIFNYFDREKQELWYYKYINKKKNYLMK